MEKGVLETPLSLENQVELKALSNMLRMARGFTLGFARVNHPSLRKRLAAKIRLSFPDKTIADVALNPASESGIVPQMETALADRRVEAVFVYGLDSMFDLRVNQSPAMGLLNLNRDYFARRFPWPVIFWVAEFAVREISLQAPDFWSWRSGTYYFLGDAEDAQTTLGRLDRGLVWSLSLREKRERREILQHVLAELETASDRDPNALARVLALLGQAASFEGQNARAAELFERALPIYRQIGARQGEAGCIRSLGDMAHMQARYQEAQQLLEQALTLYHQIGDQQGEADCIQSLGDVARMQDRYEEAQQAYQQALILYRQMGDQQGEADCIQSLGDVALSQARYQEAQQAYQQALRIFRQIGSRLGEANCIKSLGDVARMEARYQEAQQAYRQALPIFRQIGSRLGEANCMLSMGRLGRRIRDWELARSAYREAETLFAAMGLTDRARQAREEASQAELVRS